MLVCSNKLITHMRNFSQNLLGGEFSLGPSPFRVLSSNLTSAMPATGNIAGMMKTDCEAYMIYETCEQ